MPVKVLLGFVHAGAAHRQRGDTAGRNIILQRRPQYTLDRLQQRF